MLHGNLRENSKPKNNMFCIQSPSDSSSQLNADCEEMIIEPNLLSKPQLKYSDLSNNGALACTSSSQLETLCPNSKMPEKFVCICEFCGATFNLSVDLKSHLPIHTNGTPQLCDLCGGIFLPSPPFDSSMPNKVDKSICSVCAAEIICEADEKANKTIEEKQDCSYRKFEQVPTMGIPYISMSKEDTVSSLPSDRVNVIVKKPNDPTPLLLGLLCVQEKREIAPNVIIITNVMVPALCPTTQQKCVTESSARDIQTAPEYIDRPWLCEFCGKTYRSTSGLSNHRETHIKKKPFSCDVCGKAFTRKIYAKQHTAVHTGAKPHNCDLCDQFFGSYANLYYHKKVKHCKEERSHKCMICDKAFTNARSLQSHVGTHTKPFSCDICDENFSFKESLKRHHLLIHMQASAKKYLCETCGKAFASKSGLDFHTPNHTGEKPYVCQVCQKPFAQKYNLKIHSLSHEKDKPFPCTLCDKSFHRNESLKLHLRTHTGEKPFICQECGKLFSQKSSLTSHVLIHKNWRPFVCKVCFKAFRQSKSLRSHSRIHPKNLR